ncbi:MAG: carboxypeptidase regulatory-like domain-containing protein, partial [Acidobacteria bacterium]|nr:carboxypeptidase regulatory-like domain-containing protein [Acidobacteriota bacterium]
MNRRAVCTLLFSLVLVTALSAQTTTGRISGRVTDESGASVPNVKVNLTNEATGVGRDTNTNESGDYSFLEVPVGDYTLTFDVSGFQKNIRKNVTVQLNQVLTLNTTLKVGTASEVIDVSSEAPLVDTTTTQLGAVVGAGAVSNLPLNARDTYQLLQLQPGVQGVGGTDLFFGSNQAGAVSVNGGRGRANNFSVNGGDGNDLFVNGPAIQPSPDSIQEFRVLTNTFDAEYGRNSGAVINVVTKSGTNNFHGNVYEFFRNKALNAKAYLDPFKADNKQNVFGGTFGGPVKKDRTFFFGSYEGRRNIQGFSSDPVFVPTAAQRAGNFSDTPFTGTLNSPIVAAVLQQRCGALLGTTPAVGSNWSDIFPNSVIPTQCMDPVALDLMNRFVPLPNQGGNVWQDVPIGRTRDDQFTAKVDHKLTDKQSLNIYYYFIDTNQRQPFTRFEALTPNLLPGFGNQSLIRNQQWNDAHTWTLGPSAVNQFRFTYFREAQGTFLH